MEKNILPVDVRGLKRLCLRSLIVERRSRYVTLPWQQNFWIATNRGAGKLAEKTKALKCMTFLCINTLRNKTVFHTILPSLANANDRLCQERCMVEIQKFCYHGSVTLHFSTPYLPLVVPVKWLLGFSWFNAADIMRSAGHYLANKGGGLGLKDTKRPVLTQINK